MIYMFFKRANSVNALPDKILDQIMRYVKELINISPQNMNKKKIGYFDLDMNVVGSHYNKLSNDTFFEHINSLFQWSIKEIRKLGKYAHLGEKLEKIRQDLSKVVKENPDLDGLNFGDKMGVYHGDLHGYNVLIDPKTNDITGIIDWDFCSHGYEFVEMELKFLKDWFFDEELGQAMMKRIEEYNSPAKIQLMDCFKNSRNGQKYRYELTELGTKAYLMVFYSSTWLPIDCEPGLSVRVLIDQRADDFKKSLDKIPDLITELRTYTCKN